MGLDDIKDLIPSDAHPEGPRKYGVKRTKLERERDMPVIGGMYVRGIPVVEIRERINSQYPEERQVSKETIYNDLRHIRKAWLESTLVDFNELKSKELARLDEVERELWESWERSKEPEIEIEYTDHSGQVPLRTGDVVDVENMTIRQKETHPTGDVNVMKAIMEVIQIRSKLLGLMETERFMVDWRTEAHAMGWSTRQTDDFYNSIVNKFVDAIKSVGGDKDTQDAEFTMREGQDE